MDMHRLPNADVVLLGTHIAEVIVDDGVELNEVMLDRFQRFLEAYLSPPYSLLINKINAYSYDFTAQLRVSSLGPFHAIAVLAYNPAARTASEYMAGLSRTARWNLKIFSERDAALRWLKDQQVAVGDLRPAAGPEEPADRLRSD